MADENSWRTPIFRRSVVAKIGQAIRLSGINTPRNSIEMESHVFQKAKNKEEYLGFVAMLILRVREMKPKQGGGMAVPGQGQGGPGMPDQINALQTLASQGTRNSMMTMGPQAAQMGGPQQSPATNLLQTLNRGPSQQMMMGGLPGNMSGAMPMQKSIEAPCGHWLTATCGETITAMICSEPCSKVLSCGHVCIAKCGKKCECEYITTEECPNSLSDRLRRFKKHKIGQKLKNLIE